MHGRKLQNCRWNFDAIYHSPRDISIYGLGGRIAISGCQSLSQSFAGTFFEVAMVDNPRVQLETNKFVVVLLKLVGAFLPPSATRVRKNRSAIRGLNRLYARSVVKAPSSLTPLVFLNL